MAEVRLEGVCKNFGETAAVRDMDLAVADGEMLVLLGPTGAGKTTTLRLVAGLEKADQGRVLVGGHDVTDAPPAERNVSFVFQQYSLYPHLSVYDNLAFPLRSPIHRLPEDEVRKRVGDIAALLHIEGKLGNKATELSGGEMQRVSIGRSLVRSPDAYLMDEPLSSLDAKLRAELRLEIKRIKEELRATMLYVTHDQMEAMTMADRIGVMNEGRIAQVGTPQEIYEKPSNTYVAARLGQPAINLIPRDLLPVDGMPEGTMSLGARTEHLHIEPNQGGDAEVSWIEHLGSENHLHVSQGGTGLIVLAEPMSSIKPGDKVRISLRDPLFFDADGARLEPA